MRIALVINRAAGSFRRLPLEETVAAVAAALEDGGNNTVDVTMVGSRDLAARLSALAAAGDLDAVVVGGGDGSLLTAILAGLGQRVPVGILPLGTLNLFARDIGLPADPIAAAGLLAEARPSEIDLAEVNGMPFAIWASLGMHPWMVRRRDHLQREGMGKWPAMAMAALRAFRRYPLVKVTLMHAHGSMEVTTPMLVITNNAWKPERPPLSRQSLDHGELVVYLARCSSRLSLLWLAINALFGRWRDNQLLETFTATEVRVVGRKRRAMLSLDGEVTVMRSPLVFRCRPHGLRVLMPQGRPG